MYHPTRKLSKEKTKMLQVAGYGSRQKIRVVAGCELRVEMPVVQEAVHVDR